MVDRQKRGAVVWLTGLSGAGKSTLATALCPRLEERGRAVELLDGDAVRETLCRGLGFSREDRDTSVGRIAFVAKLLAKHGVIVVVSAISPYKAAREDARRSIGDFIEVHVAPPLDACIERDPKGLYAKAIAEEIPQFTGISDPYEAPLAAEVTLDTRALDVPECIARIEAKLEALGYLGAPHP